MGLTASLIQSETDLSECLSACLSFPKSVCVRLRQEKKKKSMKTSPAMTGQLRQKHCKFAVNSVWRHVYISYQSPLPVIFKKMCAAMLLGNGGCIRRRQRERLQQSARSHTLNTHKSKKRQPPASLKVL